MILSEIEALVYNFINEPERRTDQGYIHLLINTGLREFVKITGILRRRAQVKIANGVGHLTAIPDAIRFAGRILRVEDANNSNKGLVLTNEYTLDVTKGPHWRNNTDGPLSNWMRGTPNEGDLDGFNTLLVYPAVPSGLVNVFYVKNPDILTRDSQTSEVPEMFHVAPVWWATNIILRSRGVIPMADFALAQWQLELDRAAQEVASWQSKMGAQS